MNATSHLQALIYPFMHILQLLRDLIRFAYCAILCFGNLLVCNFPVCVTLCRAMGNSFKSALIELVNTCISIISLVSRTLSTVYNMGYYNHQNELITIQINENVTYCTVEDAHNFEKLQAFKLV